MTPAAKQTEHKHCSTCGGTGFVLFERGTWSYTGADGATRTGTNRWAERCPVLLGRDGDREEVPF